MRVFLMVLFCFSIFLSPCNASNLHVFSNYNMYLDEDSIRFSDSNGIFTGNTDGVSFIVFNSDRSTVATMYLSQDGFFKPIDIYFHKTSEKIAETIKNIEDKNNNIKELLKKYDDDLSPEMKTEAKTAVKDVENAVDNVKRVYRNTPLVHCSRNEYLIEVYYFMQDYTSNHWDEIYMNSATKGQRIMLK